MASANPTIDDENGTNPGAALKTLFEQHGPAVVLIDEWVAYARQLRDGDDGDRLAGGNFDTQFTFAQALTEAASAAEKSQFVRACDTVTATICLMAKWS